MNRRAGLTFVELLMAATLCSILMVGLVGHLRGGVAAWRRTTEATEELQWARGTFERLRQDLANAVMLDARPEAPLKPSFTSEGMQFHLVRPASPPVAGSARGVTGGSGGATVEWVSYRVGPAPNGQGTALIRQGEVLWPGVRALSVRYGSLSSGGSALTWVSSWPDATKLPKLIELTIDVEGASQLRQVVVIPSGTLQPSDGKTPL